MRRSARSTKATGSARTSSGLRPRTAARANAYFSKRLGWDRALPSIARKKGWASAPPWALSLVRLIARWQAANGIRPTGVLGPASWTQLRDQTTGATAPSDGATTPDDGTPAADATPTPAEPAEPTGAGDAGGGGGAGAVDSGTGGDGGQDGAAPDGGADKSGGSAKDANGGKSDSEVFVGQVG